MGDDWTGPTVSRRKLLAAFGSVSGFVGVASAALGPDQTQSLEVGNMALTEATRVKGTGRWVGPDANKSDVSPDAGREYKAVDTQVEYYGDGSQWVKTGVGSSSEAVSEVYTQSQTINDSVTYPDGSTVTTSPGGESITSSDHTTVTVDSGGGADYPSIQAAVDDARKRREHEYIIDVQDGHDESVGGDGHVIVRGASHEGFSTGNRGFGTPGEHYQLQILGNKSTPSNVKVDSLTAVGCVGVESPQIWGIEFQGAENPDIDESACVNFSGCTEAFIGDCTFLSGNAGIGIQVYKGGMHIRDTGFGPNNYGRMITCKRGGVVSTDGGISGNGSTSGIASQATGINIMPTANGFTGDNFDYEYDAPALNVGKGKLAWQSAQSNEIGFRDNSGNLQYLINGYSRTEFRDYDNGLNRFVIEGKGWGNSQIENLSGQTGDFDGQVRLDDGTNTASRGIPCTWDGAGSQWVPHDGSATFT